MYIVDTVEVRIDSVPTGTELIDIIRENNLEDYNLASIDSDLAYMTMIITLTFKKNRER